MGSNTDKKTKRNEDEDKVRVSFLALFRYCKWYESLATITGIILGLLSGGGVCYNLMQLGELSTSFVERTTNIQGTSSHMPLLSLFGGGRRLSNASYEENMQALLEDGTALGKGMAVSVAISIALVTASVALVNWSALRQITRIRYLYLKSVLRQDMSWYDTASGFNLASRLSDDMLKLKDGIGEKLTIVANLVGTALICTFAALPMGWQLALACISVMPFSIAASVALSNYQTKSSMRELEAYSFAGNLVEEVFKSIRTVVAFGGEKKEVERYDHLLAPAERYGRRRGVFTGLGTGFNWVLTYSVNAIGIAYGTKLVLDDYSLPTDERTYQVGDILSILFSVYMATQSITFCVPHGESFANARAAASNIFALIDRVPSIDAMMQGGVTPRRLLGNIEIEDVHFSYPSRPDITVLKGLSLKVKAGETVALVGPSGCGKSSILQLVQRLYDPLSGYIKLDSRDVKKLNVNWLRSSLGVVGQEPVLFRGTIHDNISIGDPEATIEDVKRAAELAYAHDFITQLPNGYDTIIGERGASLSGGQKQRIAIARSLLREPAVLLLDEATSALDPHSEKQVQAALDQASVGRTTIVVSHRLSTIVNANRIICMDQGAIAEEGTHEELMKIKGFYWKLVTTDKESKEPDVIETLTEEPDNNDAPSLQPRTDVKRRSRRIHRHHSLRRGSDNKKSHPDDIPFNYLQESHDWMTPRGSICSVMSTGLHNFAYSGDNETEIEEDEEDIPAVSDWQLLKLNGPEWPLMVIGGIAAAVQGICFPVFALLFGNAIGFFELEDHDEILRQSALVAGMFVLVATIAGMSMCLQSATFTSAGLKMTNRLRVQCFESYLKQEIAYYDSQKNTIGALCARLSGDAAEIQGATGLRVGLIIQGVTSVLAGFIMGLCYDWKLTLFGTAFLPIMVGSIWLEGIVSQKSMSDERDAMEEASTIATEAVLSVRTVHSLGIEKLFLEKYRSTLEPARKAVAEKTRWRGLVLSMGLFVPFVSYCSATVYGTSLIAKENLHYKVVLLVTEAVMYGAYMLGQSLVYAPSFNSAKVCGAKILSVIKREPKVQTESVVKDRKDWMATGHLSLKNVEFSYPTRPAQRILRGINLKAEAGKTIALVGPSGCGKSTVIQLLQRFYDPDSGNLELDGRDTRTVLTLPRLRKQLGVVQQEPVLFDRTLAENIAYGDNSKKVSIQEVIAAAKAANIHSFIVSLPKGYDTNLGSSGAQLSGGQKQRVCIARALVRSPRVLMLDEATSALDANSEKAVTDALEVASKGRTVITIAHRLSTIKDADVICVLDKGKIVEKGSHAELIELRGHYWRMRQTQGGDV